MEYQKIIHLLDNTSNQPYRTKNWFEINDESRREHNTNNQILKSSICDYSDTCILVKEIITVNNTAAADADTNNANKKVIFNNCSLFTDCKYEISNAEIDNAKNIDIVMPMHNLTEHSGNY